MPLFWVTSGYALMSLLSQTLKQFSFFWGGDLCWQVARQGQTSQESYHDKAREHPEDGKMLFCFSQLYHLTCTICEYWYILLFLFASKKLEAYVIRLCPLFEQNGKENPENLLLTCNTYFHNYKTEWVKGLWISFGFQILYGREMSIMSFSLFLILPNILIVIFSIFSCIFTKSDSLHRFIFQQD